jgi:hypothetical protein
MARIVAEERARLRSEIDLYSAARSSGFDGRRNSTSRYSGADVELETPAELRPRERTDPDLGYGHEGRRTNAKMRVFLSKFLPN